MDFSLSESERAEKRAADREYARQAVEALRTSDGWRRWLTTRASFHNYSLANQFLIAMPNMADPTFSGTVVYLCDHSERGGVVRRYRATQYGRRPCRRDLLPSVR